jgi:ABC-type sugar transport system ATPase subunit
VAGGASSDRWAIEARGIVKRFPGQLALDGIDFQVGAGEVNALVGENGAGKSTLIKVLAGELVPDEGSLRLFGAPAELRSPADALRRGLGFIHQVPALVPSVSVTENIVLGSGYQRTTLGTIAWRGQHRAVAETLRSVGLAHVSPKERLANLSVSEQQLVALGRLLHTKAKVLVLDEVTAPLTGVEVDRLFGILRELVSGGLSVVYVSHRLEEVFRIAHTATVLRNGRLIGRRAITDLDTPSLTRLIVGRDLGNVFASHARSAPVGPARLTVQGLCSDKLRDVSLRVAPNEILGVAGLSGAGRSELLGALFGSEPVRAGSVQLDGVRLRLRHPADAIKAGIALVTEDRKIDGFAATATIWETMLLPWMRRFRRAGLLSPRRARAHASAQAEHFDVRPRRVQTKMASLSGGNQQKVLLARWIMPGTKVLLLDEPTHGVDVGAKTEIYRLIRQAANEGLSVVMASSEMEEFEALCGRVVLLDNGAVLGELTGAQISKDTILHCLLTRQPPEPAPTGSAA